ncbi:hypothetical protein TNCV_608171 [Trichonephila clavipes]|nr:hypothetical protein TNCV_608171 [Trichonephila clavipes]
MALGGSLPQINLDVQGVTQGGHHKGPYEEFCLCKPRRLRRCPGCEDCRRSWRYPGDVQVWCECGKRILAYLSGKLRSRILVDQTSLMVNELESFGVKAA